MFDCPAVTIYTDGACSGNPGEGGWGVIFLFDDQREFYIGGHCDKTTNNRMELYAVIEGLKYLKSIKHKVELYTDSQYVSRGITEWIYSWKKNGWITSNRKPIKNKDLWIELDDISLLHDVTWKWIRGHDGNEYNEKVDKLARNYLAKVDM